MWHSARVQTNEPEGRRAFAVATGMTRCGRTGCREAATTGIAKGNIPRNGSTVAHDPPEEHRGGVDLERVVASHGLVGGAVTIRLAGE